MLYLEVKAQLRATPSTARAAHAHHDADATQHRTQPPHAVLPDTDAI
jgi:hypothetical protein